MVKRIIIGKQKKNFTKVEDVEIIKILKNPDQKSFLKFQNIFKNRINYLIGKHSFKGSDIETKLIEITEDLYIELRNNLEIPNNLNIFTYANKQIEWRLLDFLKNQREKNIDISGECSNSDEFLYGSYGDIAMDSMGTYEGLHSIKESKEYFKVIKRKTIKKNIKLDGEQMKHFNLLFNLLFSFLESFEIINNFQKKILLLKIAEGKKLNEITEILNSTGNIVKKQYLRAKELIILFFSKNNSIALEGYVYKYFKLDEICSFLNMKRIMEGGETQNYNRINFKDREILENDYSFFKWILFDLADFAKLLLIKYTEKKLIEDNDLLEDIFIENEGELLDYISMQELGFNNDRTLRDLNILDLAKAINSILDNIEYFEEVVYKNK